MSQSVEEYIVNGRHWLRQHSGSRHSKHGVQPVAAGKDCALLKTCAFLLP